MRRVLFAVFLSSFITPFMTSGLSVALPIIASDFSVGSAEAMAVFVLLNLAVAMWVLPFGRLADMWGPHVVFRAGLGVAGVGFLLAALSPAIGFFYASLLVAGVGLAAVFGSNNALIFHLVPPEKRAEAVGLNSMSVYVGLVAGPVLGGAVSQLSWRLILAIGAALAAVPYAMVMKSPRPVGGGRFDVLGSALLAASTALVVVGVYAGSPSLAIPGVMLLAAAFFVEWKSPSPVLDVGLFRNYVFAASLAAALLNYLATSALQPSLSLLFQKAFAMPPHYAGLLLSAQAAAMALFSPIAGRAGRRLPLAALAAAGSAILAGMLFAYSAAPSPATAPLALFLIGVGFALFIVPNTTIILSAAPPERRGTASALIAEARVVGMALSNAVAGLIMKNAPNIKAGVSSVLVFLAYVSLATLALSLVRAGSRRGERRKNAVSKPSTR